MENYAWREEVLPLISAHVETGEPLPAELLSAARLTRHSRRAAAVRQLEFALFDFRAARRVHPAERRRGRGDPR
jgi:oligopeptidase A